MEDADSLSDSRDSKDDAAASAKAANETPSTVGRKRAREQSSAAESSAPAAAAPSAEADSAATAPDSSKSHESSESSQSSGEQSSKPERGSERDANGEPARKKKKKGQNMGSLAFNGPVGPNYRPFLGYKKVGSKKKNSKGKRGK